MKESISSTYGYKPLLNHLYCVNSVIAFVLSTMNQKLCRRHLHLGISFIGNSYNHYNHSVTYPTNVETYFSWKYLRISLFGRYLNSYIGASIAVTQKRPTGGRIAIWLLKLKMSKVSNQLEWRFDTGRNEIIAQYCQSILHIGDVCSCTVVFVNDAGIQAEDATMPFIRGKTGHDDTTSEMPVEIVLFAYEIMAVLIAMTVFSCMFVFICICTQEKASVPEKLQRFNRWKARKEARSQKASSKHSRKGKSPRGQQLTVPALNINKSQRCKSDGGSMEVTEKKSQREVRIQEDKIEIISEVTSYNRERLGETTREEGENDN